MPDLPYRRPLRRLLRGSLPIRQAPIPEPSSGSMSASRPNQQDGTQAYYDYFPSMANTPQGTAQQHVAWLQTNLFQRPVYRQTALAITRSSKLQKPQLPSPDTAAVRPKAAVRLVQADTFGAARELHRLYPTDKIAVLNMANPIAPGGGFMGGSRAQEEDLCHCSSLFPSLRRGMYPIRDDELIYSPDILVVKQKDPSHSIGGPFMEERDWFSVDVISSAAVRRPNVISVQRADNDNILTSEDLYRDDRDRQMMRDKLTYIMHAALQNRVQRLVLGAFGCGVFGNPTREVARMMKEMLIDTGNGDGPPNDWAQFGLVEVVIAIFDPVRLQPVYSAFMREFREGGGLHVSGDGNVPVPDHIQYTSFPPGYTGVHLPAQQQQQETTVSDDSLFNTGGVNLSQMIPNS